MVSDEVEILTKTYKKGGSTKAVKWVCDGSPEYSMEEAERESRGTDIILHIDDESKEFLEESKIEQLLNKYCKFLPIECLLSTKFRRFSAIFAAGVLLCNLALRPELHNNHSEYCIT